MTYEYVHQSEIPSPGLIFDGETYSVNCDGDNPEDDTNSTDITKTTVSIPTREYATHLIHMVKFHCSQLFHLYDEQEFMGYLNTFYSQQSPDTPITRKERLWYIQFLLVLAFGKAFVSKRCHGRRPPSAELFTRALELLPSKVTLSREPMISVEILTCLALYIHCLDYRMSAYNYVSLHFFLWLRWLTPVADRPGHTAGHVQWHARLCRPPPSWPRRCSQISKDMVDRLCARLRNDVVAGASPVRQ